MKQHADPGFSRDVATILLDCGLRPEECFRLRPENVTDGQARDSLRQDRQRTPPHSNDPERTEPSWKCGSRTSGSREWVFPAQTKSGHIEPSSLKKQHAEGDCRGHSHTSGRDARSQDAASRASSCTPPPHLPHPLGTTHGPLDARLPRRATATCRSRNGTFTRRKQTPGPRWKRPAWL